MPAVRMSDRRARAERGWGVLYRLHVVSDVHLDECYGEDAPTVIVVSR